jgi:hypothetical protein
MQRVAGRRQLETSRTELLLWLHAYFTRRQSRKISITVYDVIDNGELPGPNFEPHSTYTFVTRFQTFPS